MNHLWCNSITCYSSELPWICPRGPTLWLTVTPESHEAWHYEVTCSDTYDGVCGQTLDSHLRALVLNTCFLPSLWLVGDMSSWRDSPEIGGKLHKRKRSGVQRELWWKIACFPVEWCCEAIVCLTPVKPKLSCSLGLQDQMYSAFNWWTPSTFRREAGHFQ